MDMLAGEGTARSSVSRETSPARPADSAARLGVYARVEPIPAEAMHLPPGSVGTIASNSVLEHLPRVDAALAAIAGVLRPGGRLVFTAPTAAFSGWLALPSARYARRRNAALRHRNCGRCRNGGDTSPAPACVWSSSARTCAARWCASGTPSSSPSRSGSAAGAPSAASSASLSDDTDCT